MKQQILGQQVTSPSGSLQGSIRGVGLSQTTGMVSSIMVEGMDGTLLYVSPQSIYQHKGVWVWNTKDDTLAERGVDILEKTVWEVSSGQRIGKVQDWAVDHGSWRLLQLEVVGPWWVWGRKQVLIPRKAIDHINEKGVWVRRKLGGRVKVGSTLGFPLLHGVRKGAW